MQRVALQTPLIEKMVSVLFVGLSDVVNRMQGNFGADRDAYLKILIAPGAADFG